jgi:hypothetical protein
MKQNLKKLSQQFVKKIMANILVEKLDRLEKNSKSSSILVTPIP